MKPADYEWWQQKGEIDRMIRRVRGLNKHVTDTDFTDGNWRIKPVGKASFLVEGKSPSSTAILKITSPATGFRHRCFRRMMGGSLPFLNETRVLECISSQRGMHAIMPELLASSPGAYMVFRFVKPSGDRSFGSLTDEDARAVGRLLSKLGKIARPGRWSFHRAVVFRWMESPRTRILGGIWFGIRRWCGFVVVLRAWKLLLDLERLNWHGPNPGWGRLIHNDLGPNNILLPEVGDPLLIDWEDAVWEVRWPLVDLVDLSLNLETGELDMRIVNEYFATDSRLNTAMTDELTLRAGFRAALLRRSGMALAMRRVDDQTKHNLARFVVEVVISDTGFSRWWKKNRPRIN